MFREDKSSFRVYLRDVCSTNNGPLSFCVSGKARWCINVVVFPSVWSENGNWGWESDFVRERERELFEVNRGYGELIQSLKNERVDYNICLPCDVMFRAAADDGDNNKHLPGDETGVAAGESNDELITYLRVTKYTKGELTMNDVDRFYDDIIICNNFIDYYYSIMNKTNLHGYYINSNNIMNLIKKELYSSKIRLIFDDGVRQLLLMNI